MGELVFVEVVEANCVHMSFAKQLYRLDDDVAVDDTPVPIDEDRGNLSDGLDALSDIRDVDFARLS